MPIFLWRAPRASRLRVAVLAALFLPAAALADPAPETRPPPDARTLDAVQVQGHRSPIHAERALTPGGVSVVDGESFHRRPVTNMADALRYVPGVWIESSTGGDAVFVSSRGSNLDATGYDGNGIKLFQDGLPVSTADGNNHNRFLDPAAARHVVVVRGANALTYGASNLGGAIDFISPTARDSPPAQAAFAGGSHGLWSGRLSGGGVSGDFDGLLTLDALGRDGHREHSRQDRAGLYANAGWRATPALELRLFASYIDSEEELAGGLSRAQFDADPYQASPSGVGGHFQLDVRTTRLAAKANWEPGDGRRLEAGLSWETQHLYHPIVDKVMVDVDGPGPMPPVEVFSLLRMTDQRTAGGMLRYGARIGGHDLLAGINLARTRETGGNYRNDGGRRNGLTGTVDNRSDSVEVFLVDRWRFAPDWTLVYGAQGVLTGRDVRSVDIASGSARNPRVDYASFNPRLGAIRSLGSAGEAYASLSRLYEAPTVFELEDDVRGGGATLEAMHGVVIEAGLRGASAAWHWDVSLYHARIRDAILSVEDPAAPGTSLSTNIARTVHAGLEAAIGASLQPGGGAHRVEPLLSATFNAFSFDGDPVYGDNDLPGVPDYAIRGEVMYRHAGGFFAGPTFDLVGARHADFANRYRIGAYRLFGLRLGIERERWQLFAEARNLADRAHVGTFSVRNRATPEDAILQAGMPRSLHVGLRLRF